ncbi:MAG: methyltransferase [Acidobacteriota bacterium]
MRSFIDVASSYGYAFALRSAFSNGLLVPGEEKPANTTASAILSLLRARGVIDDRDSSPLLSWALTANAYESLLRWIESCDDFLEIWQTLDSRLRNDSHATNESLWSWMYRDAEATERSTASFEWLARLTGRWLADAVLDSAAPHRVLDVGGGSGGLLIEYLARHRNATAVVLDLPPPLSRLKNLAKAARVEERCTAVAGDMRCLPLRGQWDLVVLSWILHDLPDAEAETVVAGCAPLVADGGALVIIETIDGRDSHPYRQLASLEMTLATGGGRERTAVELETMLARSGFEVVQWLPCVDWRSIIVARRQGDLVPAALRRESVHTEPSIALPTGRECGRDLPDRMTEALRELDVTIARTFGSNARSMPDEPCEIDFLIVLPSRETIGETLHEVTAVVQALATVGFRGSISPSFELQTWFGLNAIQPALHLILHPSPQMLLRLESDSLLQNVLTAEEWERLRAPRVAAEVDRHMDLVEKATHALILLLNRDESLQALARIHAGRVARYFERWTPSRPGRRAPAGPQSMEDALAFYGSMDWRKP